MEDWALTGGLRYARDRKRSHGSLGQRHLGFWRVVSRRRIRCLLGVAGWLATDFSRVNLKMIEAPRMCRTRPTFPGIIPMRVWPTYAMRGATKAAALIPAIESLDADIFEFDDEEVNSVELGAKMSLLDGAATLNLAVFHTEMSDLQVSTFVDSGFIVGNAAESTSTGFEAEGRWIATSYLDFGLSLGYLDSSYDDFPGAPCTNAQLSSADPVAAGCIGYTAANPGLGLTNQKGETAGRSPEWTGTFAANVQFPRRRYDGIQGKLWMCCTRMS